MKCTYSLPQAPQETMKGSDLIRCVNMTGGLTDIGVGKQGHTQTLHAMKSY